MKKSLIIDPTAGGGKSAVALAPRPMDLAGKVVGLLDNTKEQGTLILETLGRALKEKYGAADVVLSDMAAPTVGHAKTDHLRIMGLAEAAAHFAGDVLAPGGAFLCKVFQGGTERDLLDFLKQRFAVVRHVKPPASRSDSAEKPRRSDIRMETVFSSPPSRSASRSSRQRWATSGLT